MSCDFCTIPAINARFRLMEVAYHEDMNEVYKRLDHLERARPFSESNHAGGYGPGRTSKILSATLLACRQCSHFGEGSGDYFCHLRMVDFPGLCQYYVQHAREID